MKYRPEIDGLRALAVLPVIGYHAGLTGFSGGYVGVDVFFVISGYLITRILAGEMADGTYSLLRFYERRARRILPALFFVIAVSTVLAWFILPPLEMQWYGQSVLATALFASNFYFLFRGSNYFSGMTEEFPLLHTWSLAVEEQFYIFFPLLLVFTWRLGLRGVVMVIAGLSALSLIGAELLSHNHQGMNFYLLPSRIWELGAGALCAMAHHARPQKPNAILALAGLALVLATVVALPHGVRFPSLWTVPPVLGTALIILYAAPANLAGRLLALPPLVWVGLASYSAYLWHQPLFAFARMALHDHPDTLTMLALSALSVLLGYVTLRLVEAPFRKRGRMSPARVVAWSGGALAGMAALGVALYVSLGAAGRPAAAHLPEDYYASVAAPIFPVMGPDLNLCSHFCTVVRPDTPARRVLLAGDSHAQDIIPALTEEARARGWELTLFIRKGCNFTRLTSYCQSAASELVSRAGEFDEVVLINRFAVPYGMDSLPAQTMRRAMDDYATVVEAILSDGPRITVIAPRPELSTDPVRAALANRVGQITVSYDLAPSADWRQLQASLKALPGVRVVNQRLFLLGLSCGEATCFNGHTGEGQPLYRDTHHLSPYAARQLVGKVAGTL